MVSTKTRSDLVSLTVHDIHTIIEHILNTAYFLLGRTIVHQRRGLPVGGASASSLTRMVLIYFDARHSQISPLPCTRQVHSRIFITTLLGIEVVILGMRYMDDYRCLWKPTSPISDLDSQFVMAYLRDRVHSRYPLPPENDDDDSFVGLHLAARHNIMSIRPRSRPHADCGVPLACPLMPYSSWAPERWKRAVFLGMVARVDSYTTPAVDKPEALAGLIRPLLDHSGFPVEVARRWSHQCGISKRQWIDAAGAALNL